MEAALEALKTSAPPLTTGTLPLGGTPAPPLPTHAVLPTSPDYLVSELYSPHLTGPIAVCPAVGATKLSTRVIHPGRYSTLDISIIKGEKGKRVRITSEALSSTLGSRIETWWRSTAAHAVFKQERLRDKGKPKN
ncbi:hypothetical protein Bbelb_035650 [Branchiostoma belcheri]|nr:hypothetical protein Bbelb_035650 [Branchiostoma belcheri]